MRASAGTLHTISPDVVLLEGHGLNKCIGERVLVIGQRHGLLVLGGRVGNGGGLTGEEIVFHCPPEVYKALLIFNTITGSRLRLLLLTVRTQATAVQVLLHLDVVECVCTVEGGRVVGVVALQRLIHIF